MPTNGRAALDFATLARLHAALDSVVETEQVIAAIHETSTSTSPAVARVRALLGEARELLRSQLVRPDRRVDPLPVDRMSGPRRTRTA